MGGSNMICPMCRRTIEGDSSDILPDRKICLLCAENVKAYAKSPKDEERVAAFDYLQNCKAISQDTVVIGAIEALIKQYGILPPKSEQSSFIEEWEHASSFSAASGKELPYVVYQVTLKEKLIGTGSRNLAELEEIINHFFNRGYRLHTLSTSNGGSKGSLYGDRIQATLVFEKVNLFK